MRNDLEINVPVDYFENDNYDRKDNFCPSFYIEHDAFTVFDLGAKFLILVFILKLKNLENINFFLYNFTFEDIGLT